MKKRISLIVSIFIVLFSIGCSDNDLTFQIRVQGKSVLIGNNLYGTFSGDANSFTIADSEMTATLTESEDISYAIYNGTNLEIQFKFIGQQNLDIIQIIDNVELTAFGSFE